MTSTALVADPAVASWPTVRPTELTTPVNGLTIVAWLSCCSASARLALAASTADWSAASCAALTAAVVAPVPPVAVPVVAVLPAEDVPVEEIPAGAAAMGAVPVEALPVEAPVEVVALVMSLSSALS